MKGKFIVLEGVEGVGKTTQARKLCDRLNSEGIHTIISREPGGIELAEEIRKVILSTKYTPDSLTELFMFSAARVEHLKGIVIPALEKGTNVICDRFIYSTVAYQGYGRGCNLGLIKHINDEVTELAPVDLAIFLDLSPNKGFKRKGGAELNDRMEQSGLEFFNKVYLGFRDMCNLGLLEKVDADRRVEEIHDDIYQQVIKLFK